MVKDPIPQQLGEKAHLRIAWSVGDFIRIAGFMIGNCCTVVSLSHLAAGFLLTAGIGRPSTTRYKQSRSSVTIYSARPTNYSLASYKVTVVCELCLVHDSYLHFCSPLRDTDMQLVLAV